MWAHRALKRQKRRLKQAPEGGYETAVEVYIKCDDGSGGGGGGGGGGGNRGNRNSAQTAGDMLRTWVSDDCGSR